MAQEVENRHGGYAKMNSETKCPFGRVCTQDCMWSIWIDGKRHAACAVAVIAARGSDNGVNVIDVKKEGK